jgi:hypothetical protein
LDETAPARWLNGYRSTYDLRGNWTRLYAPELRRGDAFGVQEVEQLLEEELQGELHLSLVSAGSGTRDYAEAALPQRGSGVGKIRLVEKVKYFRPEL